jgi:hypothetical protein
MRAIPAMTTCIGIFVFTIGIGMFIIYHSEAEAMAKQENTELRGQYESLNAKALQGSYLMACGASVALFVIFLDEERRAKEKRKKKGFFV